MLYCFVLVDYFFCCMFVSKFKKNGGKNEKDKKGIDGQAV